MNQGDVPDLELPFKVENDTEHRIVSDAEWLRGASWGDPRPGHPEGAVVHHVAEVLTNVDRYSGPGEERRRLRIVGLTHDIVQASGRSFQASGR
jgi:hypothetical protein